MPASPKASVMILPSFIIPDNPVQIGRINATVIAPDAIPPESNAMPVNMGGITKLRRIATAITGKIIYHKFTLYTTWTRPIVTDIAMPMPRAR